MATLREIRRKLHTVNNIKKITQAMEMVAASRLRRAQAKAEMSRRYSVKLEEMLHQLVAVTKDYVHPLVESRPVKKKAFIVIAGDRGLCGSYNQSIFSITEKLLKNIPPEQAVIIPVGRKAVDYFANKKWQTKNHIREWGGKINYQQIEGFTQLIIDQYLAEEFDEVWLIYTHFINIVSRKVLVEKLLNVDRQQIEEKGIPPSYIFEPTAEEIFAQILPRYCATKVQSSLNDAYASELAARIFSMRAATKNAEELLEKLTLVRNKIRQTSITRELIEITSCVETLK